MAACTLAMASHAGVNVPCKAGQRSAHQGSAVCAPVVKGVTKTPAKAKAATGTKTKGKSKATSRIGTKVAARGQKATAAAAAIERAQLQPVLAPSPSDVDCESTQTLLQGGGAQCPIAVTQNGSSLPALPQANPGTACFAALASSNASRHLSSRVPFLAASAASPETLANKSLPNKMERQELGSVIAGYGMCLDMGASWRRDAYAAEILGALDAYWRAAEAILNGLAGGKRTYGDAARAIAENDKAYRIRIGTLENKLQPTATNHPRNPTL